MIRYKEGDILSEDVEALVNTVNCVGVMGRGIALQFKKAFPDNFKAYEVVCKRNQLQPGEMFVYETGTLTNPRYVINFPTKRHWRGKSRMEDIEAGLAALTLEIETRNIRSIAIPPLGSGLGGLVWAEVRPRIEEALEGLDDVDVVIYEPRSSDADELTTQSKEVPKMTAGRAALVGLVDRYLNGLLDPFVTLLEVHKLMYFMQEAGEPLKLRYAKAPYGPYAENLRHVLHAIEGHLISGYADGGDAPDKQLHIVPGALDDATRFLRSAADTEGHLERVSDLVQGFESPFGLELLATVHWLATREQPRTSDEVIEKTYEWNPRKERFSKRQIEVALSTLANKGWIDRSLASN